MSSSPAHHHCAFTNIEATSESNGAQQSGRSTPLQPNDPAAASMLALRLSAANPQPVARKNCLLVAGGDPGTANPFIDSVCRCLAHPRITTAHYTNTSALSKEHLPISLLSPGWIESADVLVPCLFRAGPARSRSGPVFSYRLTLQDHGEICVSRAGLHEVSYCLACVPFYAAASIGS